MTIEIIKKSLETDQLPVSLSPLLAALWFDAKGNWKAAHEIVQSKEGTLSYDRIHAYLHRKEGDNFNANYWYRRCGENLPKISLEQEWEILANRFIGENR